MMCAKPYINIGVPKKLAAAVDRIISDTALGYTSRGEVLKHVLRDYILDLVRHHALTSDVMRKMTP